MTLKTTIEVPQRIASAVRKAIEHAGYDTSKFSDGQLATAYVQLCFNDQTNEKPAGVLQDDLVLASEALAELLDASPTI